MWLYLLAKNAVTEFIVIGELDDCMKIGSLAGC
jgi:hypothetical protein